MPWWGYVLAVLLLGVLPVAFYIVYCITYDSQQKSSIVINSIIRYIFYIALALVCLYGFGSALRSCASKPYEEGYEDGYQSAINEGINQTAEEPQVDENDIYRDAYSAGYQEGFDDACTIIIDRMDPEYRETWWNENIEDIEKYGIEY